jgi:hypothetical protein
MEPNRLESGAEDTLDELLKLEGGHVFRCADCKGIFQTVREWALHAISEHGSTMPGVLPVAKQ